MALEPYRRGLALYGLYSGANQVWKKSKNFRRAAQRAFQRLQREARLAGPRQVNSTSLVQRLGVPQAPPPTPTMPMRGNKTVRISDHSSYQQFEKLRFQSGRKRKLADKRQSILQTIISNYRLRVSRLTDLSSGAGAYFLTHSAQGGDTVDDLPLMLFNLSSVRQGNLSALPIRRLQVSKVVPFDGFYQWGVVQSQAVNNSGALVDNAEWQYEDNEGGVTAVGRKSFLDWVRIRLTLWGKQNAPAKYYIRLVKFSDEEYCPERYAPANGMSSNANSFYSALVKPLITDPSASQMAWPKGAMKVLKSWKVEFDPISTTEADQDPHCKALDIFHRFGKTIDYTTKDGFRPTAAQAETAGYYPENNDAGVTDKNFGVLPRHIEDSVYLMITTLSQDKAGPSPSRDNHCSLSWNIQLAHKTIQPDTFA